MLENRVYNSKSTCPECPITDVMAAFGLDFDEQLGPNRRYILTDDNTGRVYDFEVNVDRNEWISRKDNVGGKLLELVKWLPEMDIPRYHAYNCFDVYQVLNLYNDLWNMPKSVSFTNIRVGERSVISVSDIQSREVLRELAMWEISIKTAISAGCKEATVFNRADGKTSKVLALPCEGNSYYLCNGHCYRPVEDGGISVIGKYHRDQFCYVYDNWHDYLAMKEQCHRNHIGKLCENARHLIINGDKNIEKAKKFLKDNPDFREVRCLFHKGRYGDNLFLGVAEATGGSANDCSFLFGGFPSMALTMKHSIPKYFSEAFTRIDREAYEEAIGLTRVDDTRKKKQEKQDEAVKKTEVKIEPKGDAQKLPIKSDNLISKPRGFRR